MAKKSIVLFDNYDGYDFDFVKKDLAERLDIPEEEVTDEMVWRELSDEESDDYMYAMLTLDKMFDGREVVMKGKAGTWRGNFDAVNKYDNVRAAMNDITKDCDHRKIEVIGRAVHITASHHDGTHHMVLKVVTTKGADLYEDWNYGNKPSIENLSHYGILDKIFSNSHYAVHPIHPYRLAE